MVGVVEVVVGDLVFANSVQSGYDCFCLAGVL